MIAIKIVLILLYLVMLSILFITERDKPKNLILWALAFFVLSIIGYVTFGISKIILYKKGKSLIKKKWEDDVYLDLVEDKLNDNYVDNDDEFYNFNHRAYKSNLTSNNRCEVISSYAEFKTDLINDLSKAENLIIFEFEKLNKKDFEPIKDILIEKAKAGVKIKMMYDRPLNYKIKKQLAKAGVKLYRFSKYNTMGSIYSNKRNIISIDNNIVYFGNLDIKNRQLKQEVDMLDAFIKLEGNAVQDVDLLLHQDATFASGKFIEFSKHETIELDETNIQFVCNSADADLELLIVKAIIMAKKSITLQLDEFIPTESIMSLLRFAINSNIDVKLMIPLKTNKRFTYYATRAYAKELALLGANVYLYDGFIRLNAIVVDEQYVITGSFNINREHINSSLQNIIIIEDKIVVENFISLFNEGVDNSYRINDARYMLLREKFFKNFV